MSTQKKTQTVPKHLGRECSSSESMSDHTDEDPANLLDGPYTTYEEFKEFHEDVQEELGWHGSTKQVMWHLMGELYPRFKEPMIRQEMQTASLDPNDCVMTEIVLPTGEKRKKITPVLVKEEPDHVWASKEAFQDTPNEPEFNEELAGNLKRESEDEPFVSGSEWYTSEEGYISESKPLPSESDSTGAEDYEENTWDPLQLEASLLQIANGLQQAADGYRELSQKVPQMDPVRATQMVSMVAKPPTVEVPEQLQNIIRSEGAHETLDLIVLGMKYDRVPNTEIMKRTGLKRDRLHEAITGMKRAGGAQAKVKQPRKKKAAMRKSYLKRKEQGEQSESESEEEELSTQSDSKAAHKQSKTPPTSTIVKLEGDAAQPSTSTAPQ